VRSGSCGNSTIALYALAGDCAGVWDDIADVRCEKPIDFAHANACSCMQVLVL